MERKNKSRMGLGFLTGMLGAYIFVEFFIRLGYLLALDSMLPESTLGYLMSTISGLVTGGLTIYISKERQLRILYFVVGTLLIMDLIAFASATNFSFERLSYRLILDISVLIGGVLAYRIITPSDSETN